MSDFTTYANALRGVLESGFTALPLRWPNDDADATVDLAPDGFVYSEIRVLDEKAVSLGPAGDQWRRDSGELSIYVYVPARTKVGTAEAYAQQIRALYPVDVAGVKVTRKTIGIGQGTDQPQGRYWAVPVIISFFADRKE